MERAGVAAVHMEDQVAQKRCGHRPNKAVVSQEEMCDRISIILKGKIIAHGTVAEVRALAGGGDDELTSVFLKLTGGSGLQEIDEVV